MRGRSLLIIILALILIGAALFFIFRRDNEANLVITFAGPSEATVGVPFELEAQITNGSGSVLREAAVNLSLPEGVVFVGSSGQKYFERRSLGTLGAGGVSSERFRLMAVGETQVVRKIEASVTYSLGSGSSFEKRAHYDVAVSGAALEVQVRAPEKALAGEEFEMAISYENKGTEILSGLALRISPPAAFTLIRATPTPDEGTSLWRLGDVKPGSRGEITFWGTMLGAEETIGEFRLMMDAAYGKERYSVAELEKTVSIAASPVSLEIAAMGGVPEAARPGDSLTYTIRYANKTDTALRDVVIKAGLKGVLFDLSSFQTNASFRSTDNTLIWNASHVPSLALLSPGGSGEVSFTARVKPSYPIRRFGDRDFTLEVNAELTSPTVPAGLEAKETVGVARDVRKVAGTIAVDALAFFRDAASGVVNSGVWPPRVNQSTQLTIHWKVRASATEMQEITARAVLASGVRMVRVVKSDSGTPEYNERTQELIWRIDRMAANRGVLDSPLEAIVQVELIPSSLQAGTTAPLMGESAITAVDGFTGITLSATDQPLTTALPDDPTIKINEGMVRP